VVVAATLMIHNKGPVVCSLCILAYDVVDSLELLAEASSGLGFRVQGLGFRVISLKLNV
jgi:hypothetical protein